MSTDSKIIRDPIHGDIKLEGLFLDLIEAPEIYLQSGSDLIAVANIDLTSHTKRKHVSEKLFNLEFNIEFGWDNYRQRG